MFFSLENLRKQIVVYNDQDRDRRSTYTLSLIMIVFFSCLPSEILIFNVF